ncbi:uncharacterized protein [Phyllobates terribilis]
MEIITSITQWESQDGSVTVIPNVGQAMSHNDLKKTVGFIFLDIHGEKSDENSRIVHVSSKNESEWRLAERFCAVLVICSSQTSVAPASSLRRFLDFCSRTYESSKNEFAQAWGRLTKPIIGIFSREGESQYSWLVNALIPDPFRDNVPKFRPCFISNEGSQQFGEVASQCTFAILYHCNPRASTSATNVMGSLYDKELDHLSSRLGKKNVIVVIDDLDDSNESQKKLILENHLSIREQAQDLFLISNKEKSSYEQNRQTMERAQVERKLQLLRDFVSKLNTEQQVHIDESCVLGKGGFGTVYKGSFNGTTAAIKKVICDENMRKHILLEVVVTM